MPFDNRHRWFCRSSDVSQVREFTVTLCTGHDVYAAEVFLQRGVGKEERPSRNEEIRGVKQWAEKKEKGNVLPFHGKSYKYSTKLYSIKSSEEKLTLS